MKAIQLRTSVQGSYLTQSEVPRPVPSKDEVLIRVHAVGITPSELEWYPTTHTKSGEAREFAIPGHEFSGVVADSSAKVDGFSVGDEVYGMNDWFAEGAAAEYCLAEPASIALKPKNLSHAMAAAVPISALTAWQGLFERAKLQHGERVLVHGGAGAVGLFAVQLAHRHGAVVVTTASSYNREFVQQLGADEVIDYRVTPFEGRLQEFDVVFDTVGGDTLQKSWSTLKPGGRMVTIASDSEGAGDERVKDAFFIVEPSHDQLVEITSQLEGGSLKVFINASVPFEGGLTAYEGRIVEKHGRGKVIIAIE